MGNGLIQVDEHVTKPGSGRKLKTMLLFPPEWVPTAPYLALPSLTAVLREAGHEVIQKDVNIDMYNLFFSDMFLIWVSARMSQQLKTLESKEAKEELTEAEQIQKASLEHHLQIDVMDLAERAEQAKAITKEFNTVRLQSRSEFGIEVQGLLFD